MLDKLLPKENSFWYWVKQHQLQSEEANYIFFFDQFEELFTYSKAQVAEFSEQLSELLYSTLPLKFKNKISEAEDNNLLSDAEHDFLYRKPEVKVVFSIRSDRLSLMNALTEKHPSILQHCYELNALNPSDARQAIVEPARLSKDFGFKTPAFSFTPEAIEKILNSVANPEDGKIEAATLQIVCRYVEDNLVAAGKRSLIDAEDLGDIADIFRQYYQSILGKLSETEKSKAQHLIEDELIDGNRRNPLSATYIKTKFGISESLLAQLEQSSLLRKERDASGRILYEVSHDSLVTAIEKVADGRRKEEHELQTIALEKQIIEEREKAKMFESLNKKSVFRYRLAILLAIISFIITGYAIHFQQQATRSLQFAFQKKAEAEIALFNNTLLEAEGLITTAKGFMGNEEYAMARKELLKARRLLMHELKLEGVQEVRKIQLMKQKQEIEKAAMLKTIDTLIDECDRKNLK